MRNGEQHPAQTLMNQWMNRPVTEPVPPVRVETDVPVEAAVPVVAAGAVVEAAAVVARPIGA